jgi:phosphoribosylformylglycinamidine cyclo-ligase
MPAPVLISTRGSGALTPARDASLAVWPSPPWEREARRVSAPAMPDSTSRPPLTYAAAGVDIDARKRFIQRIGPIAAKTHSPQVLAGVGPFGALFALGTYREPVLVSSTDSVGTKVRVASIMGRFEGIGVDLVNQNVNDVITSGADPLFFLDYIASSTLTADEKEALVRGIADACVEAGCALIGGETADMPDIYAPGDFDIVGFVVGAVERDEIIPACRPPDGGAPAGRDGSSIVAGDALIGLPSSGLHTNGFSLVRRVFGIGVGGDADHDRARLERVEPELQTTLGDALLTPHRGYTREVALVRDKVKGIAHITGGGLIENVPRILPSNLGARIDSSAWDMPPLFRLIQREGNVAEEEMWRAFNMGVGLVLAAAPPEAAGILESLPDAFAVGEVVAVEGDRRVVVE